VLDAETARCWVGILKIEVFVCLPVAWSIFSLFHNTYFIPYCGGNNEKNKPPKYIDLKHRFKMYTVYIICRIATPRLILSNAIRKKTIKYLTHHNGKISMQYVCILYVDNILCIYTTQ